jgi:hypothetical protein
MSTGQYAQRILKVMWGRLLSHQELVNLAVEPVEVGSDLTTRGLVDTSPQVSS